MVTYGKLVNRFNLVVICTLIFLCVSAASYASQNAAPAKADEAVGIAQVNLNTASVEQLTTLPGVGAALAERIIKYRTEVGKFSTPADLMAVKGIGQKKLDKMINIIVVQ